MTSAVPLLLAAVLSDPGTLVDWPSTSESFLYRIENRGSGRVLNTEYFDWGTPIVGLDRNVPESWWSSYWKVRYDSSLGAFQIINRWREDVALSCYDYDTEWNLNSGLTLDRRKIHGSPCIRISCKIRVDSRQVKYFLNNQDNGYLVNETENAPETWLSACWTFYRHAAF